MHIRHKKIELLQVGLYLRGSVQVLRESATAVQFTILFTLA